MEGETMDKIWLKAWLLCGTLDALYASVITLIQGKQDLVTMWSGVAAGPFGDGAGGWGAGGLLAGIAVHFAIMAVMVAAGLFLARNTQLGRIAPWKAGTAYGLVLYGIMYGAVLQWRFGVPFPNPDRIKVALGLFPHIFFVGIPIFALARRAMNTSPQP
jgi:hypothetical protein